MKGKKITCNMVTKKRIVSNVSKFFLWISTISLVLQVNTAVAQQSTSPSDTRIGLYYNYYLPRYTNTPLLIHRDCTCQLGYQSGLGIQKRLIGDAWLSLHTYVLGGTPGVGESNEEFGVRLEGQYRLSHITFLVGLHDEWNVDRPSNFPPPGKGADTGSEGLRETYVGFTWWIK